MPPGKMFSLIHQANSLHMGDNTQGWPHLHKDILTRKVSWAALVLTGQCPLITWILPAIAPALIMGFPRIMVDHLGPPIRAGMDPTV